ncbi:helix-turn-helix domain-containing protein [Flavisphingomonas formosensis]|uniref:helix-turn-helix domain-containing protein n=1 Tax=Flavisphingomonas formosensis TaxID=861534 RepID=UPI0012FB474D|nr:helix-turn-helix domain-containing protein [Sphingomonas formosensis]
MAEDIPFRLVERHTAGAIRAGISLDRLLEESSITRRYGDNRDVVSPLQYMLLCLNTTLAIEDANHGLAKASLGPLYGPVALRMSAAYKTLREMLVALCRFYSSTSAAMHYKLDVASATATLSLAVDAWSDQEAAYNEELQLSWLFATCMQFLGYPLPVSQVTVRDHLHHNLGQRHWAMGGPVRHGKVTSFSFPLRFLHAVPAPGSAPALFWDCHKHWLDFVSGSRTVHSVTDYVTDMGAVRFADIVKASGKSANTVRHRLQTRHGGFREARRRTLVQAATDRLRSSDESVETIADEYGFSDARSFRRFLKNATGLTPKEIRQSAGAEQSEIDGRALAKLKQLTESLGI